MPGFLRSSDSTVRLSPKRQRGTFRAGASGLALVEEPEVSRWGEGQANPPSILRGFAGFHDGNSDCAGCDRCVANVTHYRSIFLSGIRKYVNVAMFCLQQ